MCECSSEDAIQALEFKSRYHDSQTLDGVWLTLHREMSSNHITYAKKSIGVLATSRAAKQFRSISCYVPTQMLAILL